MKNVRKADVDADAACVQHEELIKKRLMCLSEDRPKAVRNVSGWTDIIVRACLEGMGEFDEETSGLEVWLKEDVL